MKTYSIFVDGSFELNYTAPTKEQALDFACAKFQGRRVKLVLMLDQNTPENLVTPILQVLVHRAVTSKFVCGVLPTVHQMYYRKLQLIRLQLRRTGHKVVAYNY